MRKIIALLMVIAMMVPLAVTASANGQTVLTTKVPAAEYKLVIPSDTLVTFGTYDTALDMISVTGASGFATNKNLRVTVTYAPFSSEDVSTTIPFSLYLGTTESGGGIIKEWTSGASVSFSGLSTGSVSSSPIYDSQEMKSMFVRVASSDWGQALGGDYKATLTFTSEVYVK